MSAIDPKRASREKEKPRGSDACVYRIFAARPDFQVGREPVADLVLSAIRVRRNPNVWANWSSREVGSRTSWICCNVM